MCVLQNIADGSVQALAFTKFAAAYLYSVFTLRATTLAQPSGQKTAAVYSREQYILMTIIGITSACVLPKFVPMLPCAAA